MADLIYCELFKLKRSSIVPISILGVMATPCLMFVESLQMHAKHPERIFTLTDIYNDSLLYMMLLVNILIYVAMTAYMFSREYAENTLKTMLPIPVSRTKLLLGKFCTLFLWVIMLTFVTWGGILLLSGLYHILYRLEGYHYLVALKWLPKFILGSTLMFLTISPFAYIAQKTKGFVAPVIASSVIVMGSVALTNQDLGALYPWTAIYFWIQGRIPDTGYSLLLSVVIIFGVSTVGFFLTFHYFKKEDLK